jgi:hypothetical protein
VPVATGNFSSAYWAIVLLWVNVYFQSLNVRLEPIKSYLRIFRGNFVPLIVFVRVICSLYDTYTPMHSPTRTCVYVRICVTEDTVTSLHIYFSCKPVINFHSYCTATPRIVYHSFLLAPAANTVRI